MSACTNAVDEFISRLRGSFRSEQFGEYCVIICPFSRPDGEAIEITVAQDPDGRLRISDAGESIDYLFANGLEIFKNPNHLRQVHRIARRFAVGFEDGELVAIVAANQAGEALEHVISAAHEASCLVFRRAERAVTNFSDEVEKLLIAGSLQYDRGYSIAGATKDHQVAFHLNSRGNRLVDPVSASSKSSAQAKAERLVFKWGDIKRVHPEAQGIAVLDDRGERASAVWEGIPAHVLQNYADAVIAWSERQRLLDFLTHDQPGLPSRGETPRGHDSH
ncbi:MAG TPA: DUF1828 domain-containing protein [Chloroflexota bacterium]|nr:DUF1828 domain-containing protein [Chloroflexota bacterium]